MWNDAAYKHVFMLVHQVALLHHLVQFDLTLALDDGLPTDGARVVVIGPVEQAVQVEDVLIVALKRHYLVLVLEVYEADGAFEVAGGEGT